LEDPRGRPSPRPCSQEVIFLYFSSFVFPKTVRPCFFSFFFFFSPDPRISPGQISFSLPIPPTFCLLLISAFVGSGVFCPLLCLRRFQKEPQPAQAGTFLPSADQYLKNPLVSWGPFTHYGPFLFLLRCLSSRPHLTFCPTAPHSNVSAPA